MSAKECQEHRWHYQQKDLFFKMFEIENIQVAIIIPSR